MSKSWRCSRCGAVLAWLKNGRVEIRFARGDEYLVGCPVTAKCRRCTALNELSSVEKVEA